MDIKFLALELGIFAILLDVFSLIMIYEREQWRKQNERTNK